MIKMETRRVRLCSSQKAKRLPGMEFSRNAGTVLLRKNVTASGFRREVGR